MAVAGGRLMPGRAACQCRPMCVLIAVMMAPGIAAASPLTVERAERLALQRADLTKLLEARQASAHAGIASAAAWPNPEIEIARETVDRADTTARERYYRLYQTLDVSGERGLRRDAAAARLNAARFGADRRRREVRSTVHRLFYNSLYPQRQRDAIVAARERLAALVERVNRQVEAGQAAAYDLVRLQRAVATLETRAADARATYLGHARELAAILEIGDARPPRLAGDLRPPGLPPLTAFAEQGGSLPRLRELEAEAEASRLTARAAGRAVIPDLRLAVGRKEVRENGRRFDGNTVSLSVSLPLFDRNEGERATARADARAAQAEYRLQQARLGGEVRGQWGRLQALLASLRRFASGDAESAERLLRAAEAGYRGGETGVLELVDAYDNVLDARLRLLELEKQARDAFINLQILNPEPIHVD